MSLNRTHFIDAVYSSMQQDVQSETEDMSRSVFKDMISKANDLEKRIKEIEKNKVYCEDQTKEAKKSLSNIESEIRKLLLDLKNIEKSFNEYDDMVKIYSLQIQNIKKDQKTLKRMAGGFGDQVKPIIKSNHSRINRIYVSLAHFEEKKEGAQRRMHEVRSFVNYYSDQAKKLNQEIQKYEADLGDMTYLMKKISLEKEIIELKLKNKKLL